MTIPPAWHEAWLAAIGSPPARPSSREESVQQLLEELFLGLSPAYFLKYAPTARGERLIRALWAAALGDAPPAIDWVVSEYELPVPQEWRSEIGYSYRAPDFAFGSEDRILLLELKTEWGSYRRAQIIDFLRLARRLHPKAQIDLIVLEEHLRGAQCDLDEGQRHAEMTWLQAVEVIRVQLPRDDDAARLCAFIDASLPGYAGRKDHGVATVAEALETPQERDVLPPLADRVTTCVDQALHIAPAIEADPKNRKLARGIDVPFASEGEARMAEGAIREALSRGGHTGVSTWLWRKSTGGLPATPSGGEMGVELRLHPRA